MMLELGIRGGEQAACGGRGKSKAGSERRMDEEAPRCALLDLSFGGRE